MKSYIAPVSSWKLFRTLNIESNLARPVIIQIQNIHSKYTAELPLIPGLPHVMENPENLENYDCPGMSWKNTIFQIVLEQWNSD